MTGTGPKSTKREQTRNKVILAAIDCIYEEGFNAAHTNRICERAGVSWGVLQYHFGDKDGLLQAVLDNIFEHFTQTLGKAQLTDKDLKQRISKLIKIIWPLVSGREYRVSIAILRNAGLDSNSPIEEGQLVDMWSKEISTLWQRMFDDLIETPGQSAQAMHIMFASLRGFADELNPHSRRTTRQLQKDFSALSDALTYILSQ